MGRMNLRRIILVLLLIAAPALKAQKWTISKIADDTTPCPGGKGNFLPFNEFPAVNGPWVVFVDSGMSNCIGSLGQSIWSYNLITKKFAKLVDTATTIPDPSGAGKFLSFSNLTSNTIQVNNGMVLFAAQGRGLNHSDDCNGGLYTIPITGGAIHRIVDYTMTLPGYGGSYCYPTVDVGTPSGIQGMSLSGGKVYFSALAKNPNTGSSNFGIWWAPANVNTTEAGLHLIADSSVDYQSQLPKGCADSSCWTISQWDGAFATAAGMVFSGFGNNPGPNGLFL